MKIQLRPYQIECIESIKNAYLKNAKSALIVAPTGSGKTAILTGFIEWVRGTYPRCTICFLVNRLSLLSQTVAVIERELSITVGIYDATHKDIDQVTVASIHSIEKTEVKFDIIIIDEAHNLNQESGRYMRYITKQNTFTLGVTATPFRATGRIYGENKFFKRLEWQQTLTWAKEQGFCCDYVLRHSKHQYDVSGLKSNRDDYIAKDVCRLVEGNEKNEQIVVDALGQIKSSERKKIAWACASIKHCEQIFNLLKATEDKVFIVHSKLPFANEEIAAFKKAEHGHVVFVTMLSEGFNEPSIDCICLLRPTKSPVLMVQTIGRGLRLYKGKDECLVLDYGQVIVNCGFPEEPYIRSKKISKKLEIYPCPKCLTYIKEMPCYKCGYQPPKVVRDAEKNLTINPYFIDIPKRGERWVVIKNVTINEKYVSKAGNRCVLMLFEDTNGWKYHKYFPNTSWGHCQLFDWKKKIFPLLKGEKMSMFIEKNDKGFNDVKEVRLGT